MTTQPSSVLGQRRHYVYEPMLLDPAAIWKSLSHCQVAASQALHDIRVTWDRIDDDTLIVAFSNALGEQFHAYWTVTGADVRDFDKAAPAFVRHYLLNRPGWKTQCSVERMSDERVMADDDFFGEVDGRAVSVGDLWAALQAVHLAVSAQSDRLHSIYDPQEPLFRQSENAVVEPVQKQAPLISAERRVLKYEDYQLDWEGINDQLTPREKVALTYMADIHIVWVENGGPSTFTEFSAPNKCGYQAEVFRNPARDTASEDVWYVDVTSMMKVTQVMRADVYHRLPQGQSVLISDVTGVLVVLHQWMQECEAQGYPALDQQAI